MHMISAIHFDLDGTLASLYTVEDWLPKLRAEDVSPYIEAPPMVDFDVLYPILEQLKEMGIRIIINTWLAKQASYTYDDAVRVAKLEWLERYHFPYDEIHMTRYGRTKADATRKKYDGEQILVDDNKKIRDGWHLGRTIDANNDICEELLNLVTELLKGVEE